MTTTRLTGRTAIITGAANGGGAASAALFAAHGAKVILVDIDDQSGQRLAEQLRDQGLDAVYVHADISEPGDIEAVFARLESVDILFNHAGIVTVRSFLDTTLAEWERLLRVNLTSMFLTCRAVLPGMIARGGGTILNTSSISGFTAAPLESAYCVTKGAILQLSRAIAVEYRDRGIRCNSICPGFIRTSHGLREIEELARHGVDVSEVSIAVSQGRLCEPAEFAATALNMVCPDTAFLNGASVVLDNAATVLT